MRVRCHLRERRAGLHLSLAQVSDRTGLSKGELSMIERGHMLPLDAWIPKLAAVYGGAVADWYPAGVLAARQADARICPVCENELLPGARGNAVYHPGCRHRSAGSLAFPAGVRLNGAGRPDERPASPQVPRRPLRS